MSEPIVVFGPSPSATSALVQTLVSLTAPLRCVDNPQRSPACCMRCTQYVQQYTVQQYTVQQFTVQQYTVQQLTVHSTTVQQYIVQQ